MAKEKYNEVEDLKSMLASSGRRVDALKTENAALKELLHELGQETKLFREAVNDYLVAKSDLVAHFIKTGPLLQRVAAVFKDEK